MEYIDVIWKHNFSNEPIRLVSELNSERYEVRKLEFFQSGKIGFASKESHSEGTELGTIPVSLLDEINEDPQFVGITISCTEFEILWSNHALVETNTQ